MIDPQKKKRTKKSTGLTQTEAPVKSMNNTQSRKKKAKKANHVHHLDTINFTSLLTDHLDQGKQRGTAVDPMDIDSGGESDGQSALRDVEEKEQSQGARRGPANSSMQYFHDPVPVRDNRGAMHWEFK
jgi:hypothetical protein